METKFFDNQLYKNCHHIQFFFWQYISKEVFAFDVPAHLSAYITNR